jgi:prevent-host-death family protein
MEVNIHEAKTQLSKLIERAVLGEEVIIAKAGKPLVKLVKIKPKAKRILGSAAGTIEFVEGWDKPMTDEEFDEFVRR